MATREENLATVRNIRAELIAATEGMDYCLDWKEGGGWCAREVLYHLVDTPPGGIGGVIAGVLDGSLAEVTILPDISDITPARAAADLGEALAGPLSILQTAEDAIAGVSDSDFMERAAFAHLPARGIHESRTAQAFIDGLARHWGEHLAQLRALRQALGV